LGSRHEEASKGGKQATSHSAQEIRRLGVRAIHSCRRADAWECEITLDFTV